MRLDGGLHGRTATTDDHDVALLVPFLRERMRTGRQSGSRAKSKRRGRERSVFQERSTGERHISSFTDICSIEKFLHPLDSS